MCTEPADHNPTEKCTAGQRYEVMVPDTLDIAHRMERRSMPCYNVR